MKRECSASIYVNSKSSKLLPVWKQLKRLQNSYLISNIKSYIMDEIRFYFPGKKKIVRVLNGFKRYWFKRQWFFAFKCVLVRLNVKGLNEKSFFAFNLVLTGKTA